MTDKEKYRKLCEVEKSIPIFSKDWWLDAVCGYNNWDVVIDEKNGEIVTALPFYLKKKMGFNYILQPKLSQTTNLWIKPGSDSEKNHKKISKEIKSISSIISKLPSFDWITINLNYTIQNWLPFLWENYKQTTQYTYLLKKENFFSNSFSKSLKQSIRKASEQIILTEDDITIDQFFEINSLSFSRKKNSIPYSFELVEKIDSNCIEHNCRKIFVARNDNNEIHSVMYTVWDDNMLYCLMGGTVPKYRNSNSKHLLNTKAIEFAFSKNLIFNFEGSIIKDIEYFYRQYNCELTPYFQISKVNSKLLKTYFFIKDIFSKSK